MFTIVATFIVATICCASAAESPLEYSEIEQRRSDRGMVAMANIFVPKGQWVVGATASYSTHINDDYDFLLIEGIASDGYSVDASPMLSYAIKDNMMIGARFEYGRTLLRVDKASITVGDDQTGVSVSFVDVYSIKQSFSGMATMRQYIPIGYNKRFTLFSEVRLGVGGSRSKFAFDSPVQGTYSTSVDASVSVVPGIVAFATNDVAFEVTIGALGVSFSHVDQIQNQVYEGSTNSSAMSFKLNLFSVGLGVAFYL